MFDGLDETVSIRIYFQHPIILINNCLAMSDSIRDGEITTIYIDGDRELHSPKLAHVVLKVTLEVV